MRFWSHQGYEIMRKNLTVIFPAKETAIKFIVGSQQRNSCKRVPLCASALHSGERTVADRMRPRPHLSPESVVYSCPWPLALLTRGWESQRCTSGSIHKTDTRESAPSDLHSLRLPASHHSGRAAVLSHALGTLRMHSAFRVEAHPCGALRFHRHPHLRTTYRWAPPLPLGTGGRRGGVPAPEPLGTYKQEGFLLEGSTPVPAELSQCVKRELISAQ